MVNFAASLLSLLAAASLTLAEPGSLEKRAYPTCRDDNSDIWKRGNVQEAVKCINIIAALNTKCTTDASGRVFHKCGNTVIIGQSAAPPSNFPTISSPCNDVARGAGKVMDNCSRGDGTVMGQNPAFGNGNLIVTIRGREDNE